MKVIIHANPWGFENAQLIFWCLINFFQDNGLTKLIFFKSMEEITAETELWRHHLTEEGLAFWGTAFTKYAGRLDRNSFADPADVRVLEKALKAFREKRSKELN